MFERFTDRARSVLSYAQEEATELGHPYVGTEHLLLGLLRTDGLAAQALNDAGVEYERARAGVAAGDGGGEGQLPFTPRAKRVLERALREALRLSDGFIGTEHILLGLLREEDSTGLRLLSEQGVEPDRLRAEVLQLRQARPERRRGARLNLGADAQAALSRARELAGEEGAGEVGVEHLRRALEAPGAT